MEDFNPKLIKSKTPIALAIRYSIEWLKWMFTGFSYRSQEQINIIHEEKCKPCAYYTDWGNDEGQCEVCGCPLNKRMAKDNKIAYASTKCPLPKKQRKWL